jgi:hypothetical protein
MPVTHFSHTGPHAGRLMCGIARTPDTESHHVPYAWTDNIIRAKVASGDLCPQCAALWIEAGQDEEETPDND